ncbi:hypothetical protein DACRYDRAFT_56277 [Dacryopinax primogenitus]|uniref:Uncharacterized protein n=1 Tax=Dacryopinax primogenitus (strain DJM 731) TaxID=1858805 RepID=M5G073_DACPD|nr:uncharacterized protein DACRYDRAFT_56277 [Dacryopinax primogenitus]EJT99206.1 hypothetical protein DACRYDRAFT_56277 [Dacryopinax primogenitus]
MSGRLVLSTLQSVRATGNSLYCLSPWGDSSIMILPCIRVRDVVMHAVVAATGGTAAVATPLLHVVGDSIVHAGLDCIATEVATIGTYHIAAHGMNEMLAEKIGNQFPHRSQKLETTAIMSILITLKHKHTMDDAALGFYRSSTHSDTNLLSDVADYLSIQKGWFSPYLFASKRRPVIPRAMRPDVVFCHGPFLEGDYRVAETLLSNSASVLDLAPPPPPPVPQPNKSFLNLPLLGKNSPNSSRTPSRTPSPAPEGVALPPLELPPRRLLVCLVGIKPHRALWATSARPGESIFHYLLLDGVPAIVLPALPGCPLLAWDTLTLTDMYKKVVDGAVVPEKWQGIVSILFEYLCLCVDWDRLLVPTTTANGNAEPTMDLKQSALRSAIDLLVEGAVRSVEYKDVKKNVDIDRAGIVMFRMP